MKETMMVGRAFAVLTVVALVAGCQESGADSDQMDPAELSAYLFAFEPDRTVLVPDPEDSNREIHWELRNLERVQSFLAKSCLRGTDGACGYLLLGYSEYRLDGSMVVSMSMPSVNQTGIRGALQDFVAVAGACTVTFDFSRETVTKRGACEEQDDGKLSKILVSLKSLVTEDQPAAGEIGLACDYLITASIACVENQVELCLETLPEILKKAMFVCPGRDYPNLAQSIIDAMRELSEMPICDSRAVILSCADDSARGNTGKGSSLYGSHSGCTPDRPYPGKEMVFILPDAGHGRLDVAFEGEKPRNLAIFIYENGFDPGSRSCPEKGGLDPQRCVGGGNTAAHHATEQGSYYYIVVDGETNEADGTPFKLGYSCPLAEEPEEDGFVYEDQAPNRFEVKLVFKPLCNQVQCLWANESDSFILNCAEDAPCDVELVLRIDQIHLKKESESDPPGDLLLDGKLGYLETKRDIRVDGNGTTVYGYGNGLIELPEGAHEFELGFKDVFARYDVEHLSKIEEIVVMAEGYVGSETNFPWSSVEEAPGTEDEDESPDLPLLDQPPECRQPGDPCLRNSICEKLDCTCEWSDGHSSRQPHVKVHCDVAEGEDRGVCSLPDYDLECRQDCSSPHDVILIGVTPLIDDERCQDAECRHPGQACRPNIDACRVYTCACTNGMVVQSPSNCIMLGADPFCLPMEAMVETCNRQCNAQGEDVGIDPSETGLLQGCWWELPMNPWGTN